MPDSTSEQIDRMTPEEKLLMLEYFAGSDPEGFAEAAREARARYERANGYQDGPGGDLRSRYADAIGRAILLRTPLAGIADAVLAVRDDEMAALRRQRDDARQETTALLDRLADLRTAWEHQRRGHVYRSETSDGGNRTATELADLYARVLAALDTTLAGHGPAQTHAEQVRAIEDRAERDAERYAARITALEQRITHLQAHLTREAR